eukprot:TRINITY_DN9740_c0_g1_i2.p3 TRINITY_DN9740_c0_g1~~TRINITY_DN9740_c0_g1_i2.p3  ORF type:complete len:132 (-),score=28.17 TRINITY_DN9740_c0_g1_i2:181-576(-)
MSSSSSSQQQQLLDGQGSLMDFLQAGLQQVESAQGHEDDEIRQKLKQLQDLLKAQEDIKQNLSSASKPKKASLSDLEIAAQLDQLDEQMNNFENQIAEVDEGTMSLLRKGVQVMMESSESSVNDENKRPQQ